MISIYWTLLNNEVRQLYV